MNERKCLRIKGLSLRCDAEGYHCTMHLPLLISDAMTLKVYVTQKRPIQVGVRGASDSMYWRRFDDIHLAIQYAMKKTSDPTCLIKLQAVDVLYEKQMDIFE
jgi:hypothetical protein